MSNLRDLLPITPITSNYKQIQIAVFNGNIESANNGGRCCCWVVPQGASWATFELWSAGGDGAGACCCMGPYWGPGAGQYVKRELQVTGGCFFTVCAAGSGCCAQQCCGVCGNPSWVTCGTGGGMSACAGGGHMGCVLCFRTYMGCTGICIPACSYGCNNVGNMAMPSVSGVSKVSNYCWSNMWQGAQGTPKLGNNFRQGLEYCTTQLTRDGYFGIEGPKWPGGPGNSATACGGGCCWGGYGAGGLVLITYG